MHLLFSLLTARIPFLSKFSLLGYESNVSCTSLTLLTHPLSFGWQIFHETKMEDWGEAQKVINADINQLKEQMGQILEA